MIAISFIVIQPIKVKIFAKFTITFITFIQLSNFNHELTNSILDFTEFNDLIDVFRSIAWNFGIMITVIEYQFGSSKNQIGRERISYFIGNGMIHNNITY